MNYLQPIAFLALLTLAACASTKEGKNGTQSPQSPKPSSEAAISTPEKMPEIIKAQASVTSSPPTAQSKKIAGLYFARLPCPDCGNVRVNLVLEANFTYDKTEEYLNSNDIFFDSGSWRISDGKVILFPTANGQETQSNIRLFRYENSQLTLLKTDGKPFAGKPDDYRFKKK